VKFSLIGKAVEHYVCYSHLTVSQIADKFGLDYKELADAIEDYKGTGKWVNINLYAVKQVWPPILNAIHCDYTREDYIASLEKEVFGSILLAAEELTIFFSDPRNQNVILENPEGSLAS